MIGFGMNIPVFEIHFNKKKKIEVVLLNENVRKIDVDCRID